MPVDNFRKYEQKQQQIVSVWASDGDRTTDLLIIGKTLQPLGYRGSDGKLKGSTYVIPTRQRRYVNNVIDWNEC